MPSKRRKFYKQIEEIEKFCKEVGGSLIEVNNCHYYVNSKLLKNPNVEINLKSLPYLILIFAEPPSDFCFGYKNFNNWKNALRNALESKSKTSQEYNPKFFNYFSFDPLKLAVFSKIFEEWCVKNDKDNKKLKERFNDRKK